MAFAFSPEQRDRLFDALGRSDSGACHLLEDVELALDAYGKIELESPAGTAPDVEFAQLRAHIGPLREVLYGLPEKARQLAVLGTLDDDAVGELARLANASGEALDRLSVRLAALTAAAQTTKHDPCAVAERFVHNVGKAFRNRLNIKPTPDRHGLFRRFLDTLMDLVQRRHADLDDLSRVMTDEHLAQVLGAEF